MSRTILTRLARAGRTGCGRALVLAALCAPLTAISVGLPATTAQACEVTRRVFNRTDRDIYVEIWRNGTRQWTSPDPIKPGAALALDYMTIGDEILLTGPRPVAAWEANSFGVILEIFRCDLLRISGASKLGDYDVQVSRKANADILVQNKP